MWGERLWSRELWGWEGIWLEAGDSHSPTCSIYRVSSALGKLEGPRLNWGHLPGLHLGEQLMA